MLVQGVGCEDWRQVFANTSGIDVVCVELPQSVDGMYIHNSFNKREFEMACMARVHHLDSMCKERHFERIRFLDGDVVMLEDEMFPNLSSEDIEKGLIGGIDTGTYYLDISCETVTVYLDFVASTYANPADLKKVIEKFGRFYGPASTKPRGHTGTISRHYQFNDMHMFRAFLLEKTVLTYHPDFMNTSSSATLSDTRPIKAMLVGNRGIYRYIVQIPKEYCRQASFHLLNMAGVVAAHFQGGCKIFAVELIKKLDPVFEIPLLPETETPATAPPLSNRPAPVRQSPAIQTSVTSMADHKLPPPSYINTKALSLK